MVVLRGVLFGIFGLVFGSFLTVVVYRVPRRESIVAPRSACPSCGATIGAAENLPVVSYLLQRGRCRHCGARISAEYPITELLTAGLFVAAGLRFPSAWLGAVMAAFFAVLLACALIDLRHKVIPNRIVYPSLLAFAAAAVVLWAAGLVSATSAGLGLLLCGGLLFLIALISPRGMGMGDVKLSALIGLVVGSLGLGGAVVALGSGILLGGVGGVVALALGRSRKDAIPFGPYLAAGGVIGALIGPQLASWYTGLVR